VATRPTRRLGGHSSGPFAHTGPLFQEECAVLTWIDHAGYIMAMSVSSVVVLVVARALLQAAFSARHLFIHRAARSRADPASGVERAGALGSLVEGVFADVMRCADNRLYSHWQKGGRRPLPGWRAAQVEALIAAQRHATRRATIARPAFAAYRGQGGKANASRADYDSGVRGSGPGFGDRLCVDA
jgi:hypothetical protein